MYCLKCGKEIEDGSEYCEICGANQKEIEYEPRKKDGLKEFILGAGKIIIDLDTYLGIIFALLVMIFFIFCIILSFIPDKNGYFEYVQSAPIFYLLAIIVPIIILFVVVTTKYLIYSLIDIRDYLREIAENTRKEDK